MNRIPFLLIAPTLFLLLAGCVKEDLNKLSDKFTWTPNFSLPVATITLNSGDYAGGLGFLETYNLTSEVLISETIDFDFTDIFSNPEYVEQLMFRFDIDNRFPARLELYADYLDVNSNVIKSVITDSPIFIPAPRLDSEGNVTNSSSVVVDEYVLEEDMDLLLDVKYILVQVIMKELDQSPEVLDQINDYDIEVGVGIRAYLNIPVNE